MTSTSGGNLSLMDESGSVWISPSAIDKGRLTEDDICCIKSDNTILGKHKPSSEFPFHKAIYKARPDIKAVIHAHPPALVSFSITRKIPETNIFPKAKEICGQVGYAQYELPGSDELGDMIASEFRNNDKLAIIMENHGVVVCGSNMQDAYARLEALENVALTLVNARIIDAPTILTDIQIQKYESHFSAVLSEYSSEIMSDKEGAIREYICDIIKRACRQNLMTSAFGEVSVRLQKDDFLITSSDFNRWDCKGDELILIKDTKTEQGKHPGKLALLHQEIYRTQSHVNSIIIAQPPNLMAFAISNREFDVRTIPESWIFLRDVPNIPFETLLSDSSLVTELLSKDVPALILNNEAFLVASDDLLKTFDFLEVAEFSAKSLVIATSLGDFMPLNKKQIDALRIKFLPGYIQ